MAVITLALVQSMLTELTNALTAVLQNQSYSIAGRTYTRANLLDINNMIKEWEAREKSLESNGKGIVVRQITPIA